MYRGSRKLKVAFIDPVPLVKKYPFQAVNPLGLCYIAEITKNQGHKIKIFQKLDKPKKSFIKEVINFKPDICAFSVFTNNLNFSLGLAKQLKTKLNCLIIFGGPHPTGDPTIVRNNAVDFAVLGEAENTFTELLNFIINKNNTFGKIHGIAFKKDKKIIITPPRKRIKNLDTLPFPYFAGLPRNKYKRVSAIVPLKKQKFAGVLTSRGCPFNCKFCISPLMWQQQIYFRNPKKVVDEIEILIKKYKINTVRFLDNDFTINPKHTLSVCNGLIKRKIKVSWGCFGSLRNVSLPLLKKMKQAGCAEIYYGIESLSQKNLNSVNKKLLIKNIVAGLRKTEKAGLLTSASVLLGYPTETERNFIYLDKMLKLMPIDRLELAFITPFPGTALARALQPQQYLTRNLKHFDSQTPIIKTKILPRKLLFWKKKLYRDFYYSREYKKHIWEKIKKHPETINFYRNLFDWLTENVLDMKNIKKELDI